MGFRLQQNLMTLSDLKRQFTVCRLKNACIVTKRLNLESPYLRHTCNISALLCGKYRSLATKLERIPPNESVKIDGVIIIGDITRLSL